VRPSRDSSGSNSPVAAMLNRTPARASRPPVVSASRGRNRDPSSAAYTSGMPERSEVKRIHRPSGDQLGAPCTARAWLIRQTSRPSVSRRTMAVYPPRRHVAAAMCVPSGDHRGSMYWASGPPSVIGLITRPSDETRTRREPPGTAWAATIAPSPRTSAPDSRAPRVNRVVRPARSTNKSDRMRYGSMNSSCEYRRPPFSSGTFALGLLRRPSRRGLDAGARTSMTYAP
jgi:hypothetical protein